MSTHSFKDKDVLYRFTPTEAERGLADWYWDVADKYAVVANPEASCGIIVYARYAWGKEWIANPAGTRALIARLLTDLARLEAERNHLAQLAIDNEQIEAECMAAHLLREPEAAALIHQLQSGLRKASNLARQNLGKPSIQEELAALAQGKQRRGES